MKDQLPDEYGDWFLLRWLRGNPLSFSDAHIFNKPIHRLQEKLSTWKSLVQFIKFIWLDPVIIVRTSCFNT